MQARWDGLFFSRALEFFPSRSQWGADSKVGCRRGAPDRLALASFVLDCFQPRRALGPRQHGITEQLPLHSLQVPITASEPSQSTRTPDDFAPQETPHSSTGNYTSIQRGFLASSNGFPFKYRQERSSLSSSWYAKRTSTPPTNFIAAPLLLSLLILEIAFCHRCELGEVQEKLRR